MSRGLGAVQRAILKVFEHNPGRNLDGITLAGVVLRKHQISQSEAVSFRRATRGLAKLGYLIDLGRVGRDRRRLYRARL